MKTANNFNQTANFSKLRSRGLLRKPWSAGVSPAVTSWYWWDDCILVAAGETGLLRKPWSAGVSPAVTSRCWWDDCFLDIAGETPAVQDASNFRLRSFE